MTCGYFGAVERGYNGKLYIILELAELLEGAVEKITRKTWLGCYKKTREWEDKMSNRDDHFVAGTPTEALVEAGADEELQEEGGELPGLGEDEDL